MYAGMRRTPSRRLPRRPPGYGLYPLPRHNNQHRVQEFSEMTRTEFAPGARRRRSSEWAPLILGGILGFGAGIAPVGAGLPTGPTDQTKVPHYFGPFPELGAQPVDAA